MCLVPLGSVFAQTPVNNLHYAVVEIDPVAKTLKVAVVKGMPPTGANVHYYGIPTMTVIDCNVVGYKTAANVEYYRAYVLGVPGRLRVYDADKGEAYEIVAGSPGVVFAGDVGGGGIAFPDQFFAGYLNAGYSAVVTATIGHMVNYSGYRMNGSSREPVNSSVGLVAAGRSVMQWGENGTWTGQNAGAAWGSGGGPGSLLLNYPLTGGDNSIYTQPLSGIRLRYFVGY